MAIQLATLRAMRPSYLFIMDPIEAVNIDADSSFALMLEAERRGHRVLYAGLSSLAIRGDEPVAVVQEVHLQRRRGDHVKLNPFEEVKLNDLGAIFMRKDPPFDTDYLLATYVLDHVDPERVVLVNSPEGLRNYNEKLAALNWLDLMAPSLVTANRAMARAFIEAQGRAVIKPLTGAGGAGVLLMTPDDRNLGSALDLLTQEGRRMIEVQAFIEAVEAGDKRVILLDGEPIGALNRLPQGGDIRSNMHVGGKASPAEVTDRDREIARRLKPELVRQGLIFVGIDVIGGYLTEINVTSPTGLQEIGRFESRSVEGLILDRVEKGPQGA